VTLLVAYSSRQAPPRYSEVVRLSAPTSDANDSLDQGERAYSGRMPFWEAPHCRWLLVFLALSASRRAQCSLYLGRRRDFSP